VESRKVQKSGNSSFVVSLPAEWVRAYGIRKNAPVGMVVNQDGSIIIYPRETKKAAEKPLCLLYRNERERTAMLRKMIGAYIAGFRSIEIRPDDRSFKGAIALVSDFTSMTVGQEVVEESPQMIVLRDILSPSELPMEKALLRMVNISKKMFSDSLAAIEHSDAGAREPMQQMERDIDRLWRLMARKHNMFLRLPASAEAEGITLPRASLYFLTARITERVSDHAVLICESLSCMLRRRGREGSLSQLPQLGRECAAVYERACKSVFSLDAALADSVINEANTIEERFERLLAEGTQPAASARLISMKHDIRRIAKYGAEMCENVIDFSVAAN
jgi:phosphate uptake regulator